MAERSVYVGIDVSKATLDIGTTAGETWQVPNEDGAMAALCKRLHTAVPR